MSKEVKNTIFFQQKKNWELADGGYTKEKVQTDRENRDYDREYLTKGIIKLDSADIYNMNVESEPVENSFMVTFKVGDFKVNDTKAPVYADFIFATDSKDKEEGAMWGIGMADDLKELIGISNFHSTIYTTDEKLNELLLNGENNERLQVSGKYDDYMLKPIADTKYSTDFSWAFSWNNKENKILTDKIISALEKTNPEYADMFRNKAIFWDVDGHNAFYEYDFLCRDKEESNEQFMESINDAIDGIEENYCDVDEEDREAYREPADTCDEPVNTIGKLLAMETYMVKLGVLAIDDFDNYDDLLEGLIEEPDKVLEKFRRLADETEETISKEDVEEEIEK